MVVALKLFCPACTNDTFLFFSFEERCYVGRHLTYVIFVGITQIILYAIGLPVLVFVFLWRHRDELDKPVVKFRYGLFFAGFRPKKYYWECVVALRKESTVLLAVFGPQMGIPMLAHVALLVFMIQILVQLIGQPYESRQMKLQVLDVTSIVICWGTMWSGFFFYSPRPPSQKPALEFLTVLVVLVNVMYMLVLLYSMCSETCRENESNSVVKLFRRRTISMKNVLVRTSSRRAVNSNVHRAGSVQHVQNPISQDMASSNNDSDGTYPTARPEATVPTSSSQDMVEIEMTSITTIDNTDALSRAPPVSKSTRRNKKNRRKTVLDKIKSKKNKSHQPPLPKTKAQTARRERLRSLHTKRQSLDGMDEGTVSVLSYDNPSINQNKERTVEQKEDSELQHNPMPRKLFRKIVDDEHGVCFQDVQTDETFLLLPEDGDVVLDVDELQHNPMKLV